MTLINSGGAGSRGMRLAFEKLYGIEDGFRRTEFSGRTDQQILRSAMEDHGVLRGPDAPSAGSGQRFAAELARFQEVYYDILPQTLREADGRVLPGVAELLAALTARERVRLGLATGNFRRAAFMKLGHLGIDSYFAEGGFADDAEDRGEMVGVAIARLANGAAAADVWVIGDTLLDIAAARSNGVRVLGVATGPLSVADLRDAGADAAFEDLSDTAAVLSALLGGG